MIGYKPRVPGARGMCYKDYICARRKNSVFKCRIFPDNNVVMPLGAAMEVPEKNMVNAGIVFMFTVWLQGQMSDLVIFKNNPDLLANFIDNPSRVPNAFHRIRVTYWEKQFGPVKKEFKEAFADILTDDEKRDIDELYHLRNMIAHAHVSVSRDYMLYRPFGGERREQKLIDELQLKPIDDQSDPMILKIELWREDRFKNASDLVERIEQVTFKKVAESVGVSHSMIR